MARLIVIMMLLFAPAASLRADQDDPRLDRLFALLQTTGDVRQARKAEQIIWSIWLESDNPAIRASMTNGVEAMGSWRLPDALAIFDRMVMEAPTFAEAWNKRATVHFLMGNFDQSVADIGETLALEPRHFGALSGLGRIRLRQQDEAGALAAFDSALRINPHLGNLATLTRTLRRRVEGEAL